MLRLSLQQASKALGISVEALRKRLQRGTIQGEKDDAGQWIVLLDPDDVQDDSGVDTTTELVRTLQAIVQDQRDEIAFLRQQLATKDEDLKRRDHLVLALRDIVQQQQLSAATEEEEKPRRRWWQFRR